ncbi:MAG TPA: (d)CMP kinase [Gemmatimonadales bacterium]|nr:(d)CMP kinase [Gemmatimonadales bacterium]
MARELGWAHLDSGALYRALTIAALDNLGGVTEGMSAERVVALAEDLPVRLVLAGKEFRPEVAGVGVGEVIRSERVTGAVSTIAALPEVRRWVNARQREAAASYPSGVVVDGRDIGTVVFPDARLKIFLTATPEARARRRLLQRGEVAGATAVAREAASLAARDRADASRPVAPLRAADDAVELDTTNLSLAEQVAQVVALARSEARG